MARKTIKQITEEVLGRYKENDSLQTIHILHMYPGKLTATDGISTYRFFEAVGYNRDSKEFRRLGKHDEIRPWAGLTLPLAQIGIYADGSTIISFVNEISLRSITNQTLWLN